MPLFFHFKAKRPRYGHFLDFTSTEAFVNISGENLVKGSKFELVTQISLKAPVCSFKTKYALLRVKNEGMASQNVSPALKDSSPLVNHF